jgi:hypothetical protein
MSIGPVCSATSRTMANETLSPLDVNGGQTVTGDDKAATSPVMCSVPVGPCCAGTPVIQLAVWPQRGPFQTGSSRVRTAEALRRHRW